MLKKSGTILSVVGIVIMIFASSGLLYADVISAKTSIKASQGDRKYFAQSLHRAQVAGQDAHAEASNVGAPEASQGAIFLLIGALIAGAALTQFK